MKDSSAGASPSATYRAVTGTFGLLLVGCALAIPVLVPFSDRPAMFASVALLAVGADAIFAALTARIPFVARIGPLP